MTDTGTGERATKNVDAREFSAGHANFPRLGWLVVGIAMGAAETQFGSWETALGTLLVYGVIWVLWAMYLFGRRAA